ncbi:MAG: FHA domain-containing protein [Kofleriaceae bacterium]|nr:FHA domain-containing protein [Kofleriaceae bacterium]MBP9172847.1 FHA domain-containing protein [Kofleriaceae bacterium]MBP9863210.1 FHA domain-containing protein [Kofleriaceae bacterium]
MRRCLACHTPAETNLCEACADELDTPTEFVAEQILSSAPRPRDAALVDRWGRLHRLEASTAIGRVPAARGVAIMHGVVSRHHAVLNRRPDGTWVVRDPGSSNGTRVNDHPVANETALTAGDRVTFGAVGLYFVRDDGGLVDATPSEVTSVTVRPEAAQPALGPPPGDPDEDTFSGMPTVALGFIEAPSGGGGYLDVRNRRVQLTDTQFELLLTMARRMVAEAAVPEIVRGFVPTGQLIADLPWDTHAPSENHLKQLVRRVRKALEQAAIGNLIESRRGFGYRLRVIPSGALEPTAP